MHGLTPSERREREQATDRARHERAVRHTASDAFRRCVAEALTHWQRALEFDRIPRPDLALGELGKARAAWAEGDAYLKQMEVSHGG